MGIEPTSEAWEASILPLYDARSFPRSVLIIHNETPASTGRAFPFSFHIRCLPGSRELRDTPATQCQDPNTKPRLASHIARNVGLAIFRPSHSFHSTSVSNRPVPGIWNTTCT
jgi:hypothetical protein